MATLVLNKVDDLGYTDHNEDLEQAISNHLCRKVGCSVNFSYIDNGESVRVVYKAPRYRYQLDYFFRDTKQEAQELCERLWKQQSPYVNRRYKAHFTEWHSSDGKEHKFVVWYVR